MSDVRMDWHGEEAMAMVRARVVRILYRAAITVARRAKELLSIAGTIPTGERGARDAGGRPIRVYGSNPSAPGEPPHKQTGRLRASVAYEVDEDALDARVGTNMKTGLYLELGTNRGLAPRPWLRRALAETRAKVDELLSGAGEG